MIPIGLIVVVSIHAPARGATFSNSFMSLLQSCFNPRPCARGDGITVSGTGSNLVFQSTPLREGRQDEQRRLLPAQPVSIHAPARGATRTISRSSPTTRGFNPRPCARGDLTPTRSARSRTRCFNPRPCARGDMPCSGTSPHFCSFQSTPLREGRRSQGRNQSAESRVSIHAPARGATRGYPAPRSGRLVSIHAPARGATPHEQVLHLAPQFVSIHAPARGATVRPIRPIRNVMSFNPRPCARGDRPAACWRQPRWGFNPRPCARGDASGRGDSRRQPVSIHAPARGATMVDSYLARKLAEFQSTPLREGRRPPW